jgi:hypothetical protein
MKRISRLRGTIAAFLFANCLWVIVGFGSDQPASNAKTKETDEQAAAEAEAPEDVAAQARKLFGENVIRVERRDVSGLVELLYRQVRTDMPKIEIRIKEFAEQKPEDWHLVMSGTDTDWRVALTLLMNPRAGSCMRYELDISKAGEISIVSERFVYQYARLS